MRVVAVMNYKGGVGKTTLTANLGAVAASIAEGILPQYLTASIS